MVNLLFVIIFVLFGAVVVYVLFFNKLSPALSKNVNEQVCLITNYLGSGIKTAGVNVINNHCEIAHITIDEKSLKFDTKTKREYERIFFVGKADVEEQPQAGTVEANIGALSSKLGGGSKISPSELYQQYSYLQNAQFAPVNPSGNKHLKTKEQQKKDQVFKLNKLVGSELTKCWNRMGRGQLDLYSNWYNPYDRDISNDAGLFSRLAQMGFNFVADAVTGENENPPTICTLCARVRFDLDKTELENYIALPSTTATLSNSDLMIYLMATPTSYAKRIDGTPLTKYEFLLDDPANDPNTVTYLPAFGFNTNKRMNVVFARTVTHQISKMMSWAGSKAGLIPEEDENIEPIDFIFIGDDDEVLDKCTVIANA